MAIHKLPEYIINRLKAGEVIERPASVLKELVENSLDAQSTELEIHIKDGGKNLLSVKDNGTGIELSDMDLLLERYATSKIKDDKDILNISSYGFRGEALASISEISKITITSKTKYAQIASRIQKRGTEINIDHISTNFQHGTEVIIEDLFYNVPARLKFLKSAQTEYYYCYNFFVDLALYHFNKSFKLFKDNKNIFDLTAEESIIPRINALYKKDRTNKLIPINYTSEHITLTGVVGNPSLRFGSGENIKIFVNGRAVQDKIIKKAIMDSFRRQITPGEFPLAIILIETNGSFVDVNVHPRKLEVKFMDSQHIYHAVTSAIKEAFQENKITTSPHPTSSQFSSSYSQQTEFHTSYDQPTQFSKPQYNTTSFFNNQSTPNTTNTLSNNQTFDSLATKTELTYSNYNDQLGNYQIVGQIRNSYIIIQSNEELYYVDQHALAERIGFEIMRKEYQTNIENKEQAKGLQPEPLLQPIRYEIAEISDKEEKIKQLNTLGFDCSLISENMLIVYAIPKIFITTPIDLEKIFNHILYLDEINFNKILDGIYATKACKTAIKAGHKLSYEQMSQLIRDGFKYIEGLFVCQHGRPFFIQVDKKNIDKLFDR